MAGEISILSPELEAQRELETVAEQTMLSPDAKALESHAGREAVPRLR